MIHLLWIWHTWVRYAEPCAKSRTNGTDLLYFTIKYFKRRHDTEMLSELLTCYERIPQRADNKESLLLALSCFQRFHSPLRSCDVTVMCLMMCQVLLCVVPGASSLYYSHCLWRGNQIETFSALLCFCAGNSPVTGEFPVQRPVTRSFDVFFDLRLNKDGVNYREAGDLRRHRAHYDLIVMRKITPRRARAFVRMCVCVCVRTCVSARMCVSVCRCGACLCSRGGTGLIQIMLSVMNHDRQMGRAIIG